MDGIPESFKDLLEKKAFAHLATVGGDDTPQVTPVWIDSDGRYVRFDTAQGTGQGQEPSPEPGRGADDLSRPRPDDGVDAA
jgi:Pyridoxamine 5'-phosphate oxidase